MEIKTQRRRWKRFVAGAQLALLPTTVLLFVAGLIFDKQLVDALTRYYFDWSPAVPNEEEIRSLWLGILGVHGAVGAIAPVLGFTLLTTAATPATRLAPAGFVVAEAIGWRIYLLSSLTLLAASMVACVAAPSFSGLLVATFAAVYVVASTLWKFWVGFTLLRDEERFDVCARAYLETVIVMPPEDVKLDKTVAKRLDEFNAWIKSLPPLPNGLRATVQYITVGERARTTELLSINASATKKIAAKAEKLGVSLYGTSNTLSADLQSSKAIVAVVHDKRATAGALKPVDPNPTEHEARVMEDKRGELQRTFDGLVEYGLGAWASSQTRIPLLVTRHLSTTLYEAIPGHRPHDLEYGLDALGNLIDKITSAQSRELIGPPAYKWIYDTPAYLVKQLSRPGAYDAFAFSELLGFLRVRVADWMSRGYTHSAVRYLWLMQLVLLRSIKEGANATSDVCLYMRETPFFARGNRDVLIRELGRALIVAALDEDYASDDYKLQRWKVRKTVVDMFDRERYRAGEEATGPTLEVYVSLLATAMFMSRADSKFSKHTSEVLEVIRKKLDRVNITPTHFFTLLDDVDGFVSRWRWEWWEGQKQEEGEAHFVAIHMWCTRAIVVLMSMSYPSRLQHLSDDAIPKLETLVMVKRQLQADRDWMEGLDVPYIARVEESLEALRQRKERIQILKVRNATPDQELCRNYVEDLRKQVEDEFVPYSGWLKAAGFVQYSNREMGQVSAVDFLVPKSAFVSSDVSGQSTLLATPSIASAIVEFEVKAIAEAINAACGNTLQVDSFGSPVIWNYVTSLINANESVIIIGKNISRYEIVDEVARIESEAARAKSPPPRFFSIVVESPYAEIIVGTSHAVRITRFPAPDAIGAIAEDVVDGVVAISIAPVSEVELDGWSRNSEGEPDQALRERYMDSLVSRTQWRFEANALESASSRIFEIRESE